VGMNHMRVVEPYETAAVQWLLTHRKQYHMIQPNRNSERFIKRWVPTHSFMGSSCMPSLFTECPLWLDTLCQCVWSGKTSRFLRGSFGTTGEKHARHRE
jgi:hypothetical protein